MDGPELHDFMASSVGLTPFLTSSPRFQVRDVESASQRRNSFRDTRPRLFHTNAWLGRIRGRCYCAYLRP